jgi:hypothetical protein
MVFGSNDRWIPQNSCAARASPSNHFSQHEKPIFQIGSPFSWWWFESKMIEGCPTASRRPAGATKMLFSRSNCRGWDTGPPWHEARDYLASVWRRTTIPCQKTIASETRMLIAFWGIHRIAQCHWLPKDNTLDSPFFCEEVLCPLAQKMQPDSKKLANPWLWFIWTMQWFTQQGQPKKNWMFTDSNTRRSHRMAWILHHPAFFFSGGWKPSLNGENIIGKMTYMK